MLSSIYKQMNEYLIIPSPNILETQIGGGKKKNQNRTREKQRGNIDILGIFQSLGIDYAVCYPDSMRFCPLWNTSLCFCLLEMSQVTDFHRGLEVFFSFSIASRGPCGVVSSSLSVMTAVLLAGSLQSILTYLSLSCPCLIP